MEKRIAVMSIIVEKSDSAQELNNLLHEASGIIIGRMGIPYRERNLSVISVVVDAQQNEISTLSGKIGNLDGVTVKTAYSNVISYE